MWKWIKSWGGIFKGKFLKEKSGWITDKVDDTQGILTAETVKQIYPMLKRAYELEKPLRFNIRGGLKATFKRLNEKQLVIRVEGNFVPLNYIPSKISSAKTNYFEIYFDWESLPRKFKDFMVKKEKEIVLK